jgi:hypothetical protein
MKSLGFAPLHTPPTRRKRVRPARFEQRSSLPTSAGCVVANGVRETLGSLLGVTALVRLLEPLIPDPQGWQAIVREALLYRVRGSAADAALIVRPLDAIALASAAFGEPASRTRTDCVLSAIERDVLDRLMSAIAVNLSAICGPRENGAAQRVDALSGFVTFFELLIEKPVEARIGVALSRDPAAPASGSLQLRHLERVRIAASASLELGRLRSSDVGRLTAGTVLPILAGDLHRCNLTIFGAPLARGICGVRNGNYAFAADIVGETV